MNLMVESSLRAAVVFALAFAVTRMLRRQPAAFRHVIWAGAFGIAAAAPVLLQFGPRFNIERPAPLVRLHVAPVLTAEGLAQNGALREPIPATVSLSSPATQPFPIRFLEIVWLAGVVLAGTRMWNAKRKANALLKNAAVLENPAGAGLPEFAALSVRIAETHDVATAMTLGVFRPWILLPDEHRAWEPELLRAVLLHELAHVRRRDCLVQWLPNLVCAVHWFNPLAWLARSEILCESERACDDAVLRSGISGSAFARDLVKIAQAIHSKGESLMVPAVTSKLERRIERLIDPGANRRSLTTGRAVFGLFIALALLAPIAGVRAEQAVIAPTVVSFPKLDPKVTFDAVAAPKPPRVVAQLAQAQATPTSATQPTSSAQPVPTGSLSGVVSDQSGAVIVGANVRIRPFTQTGLNQSHGNAYDYFVNEDLKSGAASPAAGGRGGVTDSYSAVTDSTGQWSIPDLPAMMYMIEIQVPGFRAFNKSVAVNQGLDNQVNASLTLGRASETVTIVASRPNLPAGPTSSSALQGSPLRVGGDVEPPKLIRNVRPVFPQSARDQGVQGAVAFLAIIGKAGFIVSAQPTTTDAPPDLVQAALDAIKQWQYLPARLNGQPVDIVTEITVNFRLE
jgi:beta-lactamase regulating signal transducer with metallopeptidase domain